MTVSRSVYRRAGGRRGCAWRVSRTMPASALYNAQLVATLDSLGYLVDGWTAQYERTLARELGHIGSRSGEHGSAAEREEAIVRAAVMTAESLFSKVLLDLADPHSSLFLAVAQVADPAMLAKAAEAAGLLVQTASRRRRATLVRLAVGGLGIFATAVADTGAEAASDAIRGDEPHAVEQVEELARTCQALADAIVVTIDDRAGADRADAVGRGELAPEEPVIPPIVRGTGPPVGHGTDHNLPIVSDPLETFGHTRPDIRRP